MKKWIKKFMTGFYYAGNGILAGFQERNMRIHGIAAIVVIMAGIVYGLSKWEWIVVMALIGMVWLAELINSSIEELANIVRDSNKLSYEATKYSRDLAAGAVLVVAIVSGIIGVIIFWPKIFN